MDLLPDKPLASPSGDGNENISASSVKEPDLVFETSRDIVTFLCVLLLPLVIISNGVVIIAAALTSILRKSPTDVIMIALCVADFLVGMCVPVYVVWEIPETYHIFRQDMSACFFRFIFTIAAPSLSLDMLFLLSLDRFVAVNWALFYKRHVDRRCVLILVVVLYLYETIETCVIVIGTMKFDIEEARLGKRCTVLNLPEWYQKTGLTVKHAAFVLPTCIFTCQITYIVVRQLARIRDQSVSVGVKVNQSDSKKNVKILLILMALFLPLWLPSVMLFWVWEYLDFDDAIMINIWARLLRVLNTVLNSVVYAYSKESYRLAYRHILTTPPTRWGQVSDVLRRQLAIASGVVVSTRATLESRNTKAPLKTYTDHSIDVYSTARNRMSKESSQGGKTTQDNSTATSLRRDSGKQNAWADASSKVMHHPASSLKRDSVKQNALA